MSDRVEIRDGLCRPAITLNPRHLLSVVCTVGGAECPLILPGLAREIVARLRSDPTLALRLVSSGDLIPYYPTLTSRDYATRPPEDVLNRKRDLDVLQRLGLIPGDTRRARYLYELLFARLETPDGICAHGTPGWEGCPQATSGAYERVRAIGWQAVVYSRPPEEMADYRSRAAERIETEDRLYVRPHHLMCLACWWSGGENESSRPNDTIWEIWQRLRRDPDVPIVLVEGCCQVCDCCDGFHPPTSRCVHAGGLIRDYKKDLDCFQKLGLMPGATLLARVMYALLFDRISSTREVCGYGTGVVTSNEWSICGGPEGCPGYVKTRERGFP